MVIELDGAKRIRAMDDDIQIAVRLTMHLTSETDSEYDKLTKIVQGLKQEGLAEKILKLMNEYAPGSRAKPIQLDR